MAQRAYLNGMERHELISHMRGRIDMCRRLAGSTTDERTAKILRQMADEVEEDVRRLEAEQAGNPEPITIEIKPTQN